MLHHFRGHGGLGARGGGKNYCDTTPHNMSSYHMTWVNVGVPSVCGFNFVVVN